MWTDDGWAGRFGLALDPADTGYGHGPGQVALVTVASAGLLTGYCDAVVERATEYVRGLSGPQVWLDRLLIAWVLDPDGHPIQLVQSLPDSPPAAA